MAATFNWCEDNGTQTGSPVHGTTRSGVGNSTFSTDSNWKNVDDCTNNSGTAYSASPITAGNNSFIKYHCGKFTGSFNQISNGKGTANCSSVGAAGSATGTGLTIKSKVTSTYATPVTTAISGATDNSAGTATSSGNAMSFSTTGPEDASPTSTLASAGYTQYLSSQLQTTSSSAAGDITTTFIGIQYNEN